MTFYTGGITGWGNGDIISNCVNIGMVAGNGNYVGGIVGFGYTNSIIRNCYYLVGTASEADGTSATQPYCSAFSQSNVLAKSFYGTTDLITALNAWVNENGSGYAHWIFVDGVTMLDVA